MRWLVLLISFNLSCSIVIHINPIQIISYRNRKSRPGQYGNDSDHGNKTDRERLKVESLIGGNESSYSGYLLANEKYGLHLFYWFFKSEQDWQTVPVVVWLQGQPNASSLYGLFEENGPYTITPNMSIQRRDSSWTTQYNVLYLDHCASCGFSYAEKREGYSMKLFHVGKNVIQALYKFFHIFPELAKNPLYLAGEAMCGKYIFVVAHGILNNNKFQNDKLNLNGILIGNGFMEGSQIAEHKGYIFQMGLLDVKQYDQLGKHENHWKALVSSGNYEEAIQHWNENCYAEIQKAGYLSMYDARDANAFWNSLVPQFVHQESFRRRLRVNDRSFNVPIQHVYYIKEAFQPLSKIVAEVLNKIKVLFYSGQFDMLVPYVHTAYFLNELDWEGVKAFYGADHSPWRIDNNTVLVGYTKTYQNLTHVMIREAGHLVGRSQSQHLVRMLKRFVNNEFEASEEFTKLYEITHSYE